MINQEKSLLHKLLPHCMAIIAFLAITMIYFSPVIDGKVLQQGDVTQYIGGSQELRDYYYNEGQSSAWTGSMFSGMPAYQIGVMGGAINFLNYIEKPFKALGDNSAGPLFTGMLMAYILFSIMGFKPSESALGAIAYSMSSYNIIIIEAGHVTKAWVLAYLPLIIAGLMAMFKRKILLGGMLLALGLAFQIKNNHLQVTYYTALLCAILFVAFAIESVMKKDIKTLLKVSGISIVAVVIAALCNMGNIYANYEMSKESTRGKSELSTPSTAEKQSSGLDKDYAFAWSYGKAETLTLLVPNVYGGASNPYGENSRTYKALINDVQSGKVSSENANQIYGGLIREYWGSQPGTSGPVYFGAVVCFLFLLGMILVKNNMKWGLLFATIFFIFLAWGKNFELFNDWFFYHFPLYSKFRAVSTALVIPAITAVIIAVWGLKEFFSGDIDKKKLSRAIYISAGITGGIAFILWAMPGSVFDFVAETDQMWQPYMSDQFRNAIMDDRREMLTEDAFRSLLFVLLATSVLLVSLRLKSDTKKVATFATFALIFLVLVDLWGVNRRFLNESSFVNKTTHQNQSFQLKPVDKAILEDKHPSYRVFNLNNPFNESGTSYYHKSIGGYHAAKLKRYQELIDNRLLAELENIGASFKSQNIDSITAALKQNTALNMLNAKYIIFNPEYAPIVNPYAMGNGWFVNEYKFVNNADEEIASLSNLDAKQTAIIDKRFEKELEGLNIVPDSTATIEMTLYKPDILKYKSKAKGEQLVVLSEIYYANGWQAYIDGKEVPHFRADWTLRAMRIPAGEHEIEFRFEPKDYHTSLMVATASSGLLVLLLLGMVGFSIFKKKENN